MNTIQIFDATTKEQEYIDYNLVQFNNSKLSFKQELPFLSISRCIREGDKVIGGILAQAYCWNILYIDVLWVKDEYRNKGYASANPHYG